MSSSAAAMTSTRRALRADALRNRARLLDTAAKVFADRGTDASLEEIARGAGVGIGTLYRHFPTRDDLVEALIHDRTEELIHLGEELLDAADPFDALTMWLRALIRQAATYRGLAASLLAAKEESKALATTCQRQRAAGAMLVHRAQEAGQVRVDVTVDDVFDLVSSIAWVTECGSQDHGDRLLAIVMDGIRPAG